jgi:type II secretory pathway predicted ATPase ExeA
MESSRPGPLAATRQRDFAAFRLTPDLRFVFPQAAHEAAFSALLDGLRDDEGILLATGEVGVGKTMLARRLERELRRRGTQVAYLPYPDLSIAEVLRSLYVALDLSAPPDRAALDVAEAVRLIAAAPPGRRTILVDDADKCSTVLLSELERLIRDTGSAGGSLQAVLFGTPDLPTRLSAEIPHVAIAAAAQTHLAPLSLEETGTYIRHRLGVLGAPQDVFSADAIEAIASYARGIPRLVNQACGRALLLAGPDRRGAISQSMILEAIEDCPAVALADPDVAAWAAATLIEERNEPQPAEPPAPVETVAAPSGPVRAAEPSLVETVSVPSEPVRAAAPSPAPAAAVEESIVAGPALDLPLQVPPPPSARNVVEPPPAGGTRRRRLRPAPDRLRWSTPAAPEAETTGPGAERPRFAGFVPRAGRPKSVPAVESVGPIDVLRQSAPADRKRGVFYAAAGGVALATAISVAAYGVLDPESARAARDKLANAAAAAIQHVRAAVTALNDRIARPLQP